MLYTAELSEAIPSKPEGPPVFSFTVLTCEHIINIVLPGTFSGPVLLVLGRHIYGPLQAGQQLPEAKGGPGTAAVAPVFSFLGSTTPDPMW